MTIADRTRATLAFAAAAASLSCGDKVNAPIVAQQPPRHVIGVAELTFHDVGSTAMSASIRLFRSIADLERLRATAATGGNLDTILVEAAETSTFTFTPPGATPLRFMEATFGVRNGVSGGVFDRSRDNVSFAAVRTANTLANTAVRMLQRADGSALSDTLARQIVPSELSAVNGEGELIDVETDAMKTLTDDDARKIALPSGASSLVRYSFVVRRTPDIVSARGLPGAEPFEGVVSFAYRMPILPSAADKPTSFSVLFLIVDDTAAPRTP